MKNQLIPVAFAFLLLCGFIPAWEEFTSEEGGFTVMMPKTPTHETSEIPTAIGPVTMHTFSASNNNKWAYMVIYSDYDAESVSAADPSTMLEGARDGVMKQLGGKIVIDRDLTIGGYPGKEVEVVTSDKQFRCRARLFLVDNRLYQVIAVVPGKAKLTKDAEKFLESFKIMIR